MLPSIAVEINNRVHEYKKIVNLLNMGLTDEAYRENLAAGSYLTTRQPGAGQALARRESAGNPYEHQQQLNGPGEGGQPDDRTQLLVHYSQLRASMKARMEELAQFYDENADDDKIHFFEKLRLKIKKTLQQKTNVQMGKQPRDKLQTK